MNTHFEYKGYLGSAEVDPEGCVLVGKLLFIRDIITYSALTVPELERAFREAVDDYLRSCADSGDEPDLPLKGSFNVRVGPERHRAAAIAARRRGIGLNDFVCVALDRTMSADLAKTVIHRHEVTVIFTGEPRHLTAFTSDPASWEISGGSAKH